MSDVENKFVLGIDAGNLETGVSVIDGQYRPLFFGKFYNFKLVGEGILDEILRKYPLAHIWIEQIVNYGAMSGSSLFETCVWNGRFQQFFVDRGIPEGDIRYVKRKQYITDFTSNPRGGDKEVKAYLIDRFAPNDGNYGKGTKANKGWFYGFAADAWSAYAIATYGMDYIKGNVAHIGR